MADREIEPQGSQAEDAGRSGCPQGPPANGPPTTGAISPEPPHSPTHYRIKNWDRFQHYHKEHRSPPWIKLHRTILDDVDLAEIPASTCYYLILMWLLGSESEGIIPADFRTLRFRLRRQQLGEKDIQVLVEYGFIEPCYHDGTNLVPTWYQPGTNMVPSRARARAPSHSPSFFKEIDTSKDSAKQGSEVGDVIPEDCMEIAAALDRVERLRGISGLRDWRWWQALGDVYDGRVDPVEQIGLMGVWFATKRGRRARYTDWKRFVSGWFKRAAEEGA